MDYYSISHQNFIYKTEYFHKPLLTVNKTNKRYLYDNSKGLVNMNIVAEKLELESLLLEHEVFYNGEVLSIDMKKIILSTALDLLNISKDHAIGK